MSEGAKILARVREIELPQYGDDEVLFMASVLERRRPSHIFEWGTNVGASARLFYEAARILKMRCEIHTIEVPANLSYLHADHPQGRLGMLLPEDTPDGDVRVISWMDDGVTTAIRLYVDLQPAKALFYIDGDHGYEQVKKELVLLHEVAPRVPLLLHDTIHLPAVDLAIREFLETVGGAYAIEILPSAAGMTALWPAAVS